MDLFIFIPHQTGRASYELLTPTLVAYDPELLSGSEKMS